MILVATGGSSQCESGDLDGKRAMHASARTYHRSIGHHHRACIIALTVGSITARRRDIVDEMTICGTLD